MTQPQITVVLPTYRRPELLRRAIETALSQTYPHLCVCVYDNASHDGTEAVVMEVAHRDPRVRYHCHATDLGMVENFRFGLARVDTPFFSILCDDDQLLPGFAAASLAAFEKYPEAKFVATSVRRVYPGGITLEPRGQWRPTVYMPPDGMFQLLHNGVLIQTGVLFRRDVLTEVGSYDPGADGAGDLDFQLRISARFPFVVDPTPGGLYFSHDSSISGERKVSFVWPTYRTIIGNLESDTRIPRAVRLRAKALLTAIVKSKLVAIALGSTLRGDQSQALLASSALRGELHSPVRSQLVDATTFMFRHFPLLRAGALRMVVLTRPFRIVGWRKSRSVQSERDPGHQ